MNKLWNISKRLLIVLALNLLKHRGRDKIAVFLQNTFSGAFVMKTVEFLFQFYLKMFASFHLVIVSIGYTLTGQ